MKPFPAIIRWLMLGMLWLGLIIPSPAKGLGHAAPRPAPEYLYTGEQIDPDLGMYYLRARYYQPATGRFWSMDSFEGSQKHPQSLHKYLYCHGNPINGTDPSGQWMLFGMGPQAIAKAMAYAIAVGVVLHVADIATRDMRLVNGSSAIERVDLNRAIQKLVRIQGYNEKLSDLISRLRNETNEQDLSVRLVDIPTGGRRMKANNVTLYISRDLAHMSSLELALTIFGEYQHTIFGGGLSEAEAELELQQLIQRLRQHLPSSELNTPYINSMHHGPNW